MWQFLTVPILCLLPGSWIAFAPARSGLGRWPRLATAIALSPIVVVIEYYAMRALGLSFARSAMLLPLINAPAILLIFRAWRAESFNGDRAPVWAVAGILAVCLGCLVLPWLVDPVFRKLSWHGLMHTDICYAIARGALVPDEPELAGVRLGYPWFGHIYWAVMAWSAEISPTQVYLVTGLVWAAATGVLCYAACRKLGGSPMISLACPVLVALGTNPLGLIGWSIIPPNDIGMYWAVLGDLRYAPFLQKYISFEAMPFGLTLFAAMMVASIECLLRNSRFLMCLIVVMLIAVGGLYPNVFPAAAVLAGAAPLVLLLFPSMASATYDRRSVIAQFVLVFIAFGVGVGLIEFFTAGREVSALAFANVSAVGKKSIAIALGLGPFACMVWALFRNEDRVRRGALLVLAIAAIGALGLNVVLRLDGLHEYKFYMCAGMVMAAPTLVGVERFWLRSVNSQRILVGGLSIGLVAVMIVYSARRIPDYAEVKPATITSGFYLSLAPGEPDEAWTSAVRERTPPDTLLVVYKPETHVSSFCARSLWIPSEKDTAHCGYNMFGRQNMVEVRGYSASLFDHRWDVIQQIYESRNPDCGAILKELAQMNRPVTVVFGTEHSRLFLDWLRGHQIGETIMDEPGGYAVYLIHSSGHIES